jgi:hypothetical protein
MIPNIFMLNKSSMVLKQLLFHFSQMVNFRRQIEETEQHLQSMMTHPGVTPQDLMSAIRLVWLG